MGKMMITLPDQMHEALQKASETEERVIASLIRKAVAEYLLKYHSVEVDHTMKWGGNRRGAGEDEK